ncbi:succinylglutamate desuccinylase/aspartoacylase family protein [Acidobacteriota bacterium]
MDRRHFVRTFLSGAAISTVAAQNINAAIYQSIAPSKFNIEDNDYPSKTFTYTTISNDITGKIEMPLGVIKGAEEGPTIAVTGGLMGSEYCGIEAASRIYKQTHPDELKGTLIVIPVVNLSSFRFRTPWLQLQNSVTPQDGKHINRSFPGTPEGTATQRLAHELFNLVTKSDVHIDLRGGDLNESHLDHTITSITGDAIDDRCIELAKVFGHRFLLKRPSAKSQGTLIYETVMTGVASIISESGLGYREQPLEENIQLHIRGVQNVMTYMKMIQGTLIKPKYQKYIFDAAKVGAPESGIFHAHVDQGEIVKENQQLGKITDLKGDILAEIKSPINGIIHEMMPNRVVYKGDMVYSIATIGEDTGWING